MKQLAYDIQPYKQLMDSKYRLSSLSNVAALIRENFSFWWQGFYLAEGGELVLGPFQGPVACNPIQFDQGVCGKAFRTKAIQCIGDVHAIDDHIACSAVSQSELVVPIIKDGCVVALLDLDSEHKHHFTKDHELFFNQLCIALSDLF